MADIRLSKSFDMVYGNRTVLPLLCSLQANKALVHGKANQVFATILGITDAHVQHSPIGYPVEVLLPYVSGLEKFSNWKTLLSKWYGVETGDTESLLQANDLLVVLDVHEGSSAPVRQRAARLMKVAKSRKSSIMVVTKPGEKVAQEMISFIGSVSGSVNTYWKIFANRTITSSVQSKAPQRIYLFGEGLRVVTSAIGAVDIYARFDEHEKSLALLAAQVMVDKDANLPATPTGIGQNEIFSPFGIRVTNDVPNVDYLEFSDRQVLITTI